MSKLVRLRQGLAAIIPEELSKKLGLEQGQEVVVKESKFGLFINPIIGKEGEKPIVPVFSKEEIELINKLLSMKFSDRTPESVNKQLNPSEKKILSSLIEKKAVNLFKSPKYKEGVYNIRDKIYGMIKDIEKQGKEKDVKAIPEKKTEKVARIGDAEETEKDPMKRLEKHGYAVIEYESEARRVSEEISSKGRKREIIGIRGFDKRYYVLKSSFFIRNQPKIKNVLKEGKKSLDQISSETGLDKQACTGILALMNDNGDVIEKRKGVFVSSE